jgi:perosamine synthetase
MRNQGRDATGTWLNHVRLGYNYRLSEVHAALGLAQLDRIDELLAARAAVAGKYSELLLGHELLEVPKEFPNFERSWFVYFVRCLGSSPAELRDRVRRSLREKGIASQIYFTPIHQQPFFEHCNPKALSCLSHTNLAGEQCLALPFHSRLTESEVEFVCDALLAALESASRELAAPRIELTSATQ